MIGIFITALPCNLPPVCMYVCVCRSWLYLIAHALVEYGRKVIGVTTGIIGKFTAAQPRNLASVCM